MSKKLELVTTLVEDYLPSGWELATIGDLVGEDGIFADGDWVESKDQDPNGDVRLIQLADIGDGEYRDRSSRFLTYKKALDLRCTFIDKGDVLVARMPDPLGRACIFPGDKKTSVTVVDVCIIRPGNDDISKRWLMYFINAPAFRTAVASLESGSTRKRISRKNLARISFPVPPSDEQKRIVAEIEKQFSRLDEAVANLKRVKANLKRYKASVLTAAVEGRLTEEWRKKHPDVEPADKLLQRILAERRKKWEEAELAKMRAKGKEPKDDKWKKKYKEPAKPELDGLPSLPDGWVWATVIQLSFVVSGQTPKGIANEPISGDIPWFKVGDMNTNGNERLMNKAEMYLTEKRAKKLGLNIQPAGTIIFPKRGGAIATNKKRILSNPSGYDLNTMGVYPIVVHHTYFWQWFLSINLGSLADGSNVPQINHGDIEPLHVPLPPFVEQIQISEVVERSMSLADGLLSIVDVNLKRADRLRQSILKKAFWGELVSQDMNDEPAITLMKKTG